MTGLQRAAPRVVPAVVERLLAANDAVHRLLAADPFPVSLRSLRRSRRF